MIRGIGPVYAKKLVRAFGEAVFYVIQQVVLVGQRKALAIAVKGVRARRRWSKLREWLSSLITHRDDSGL